MLPSEVRLWQFTMLASIGWYEVGFGVLFAALTVPVNFLARREGDPTPLLNELYIAEPLILAAISASFVYVVRALISEPPRSFEGLRFAAIGAVCFLILLVMACLDRYGDELMWETVSTRHEGQEIKVYRRKWSQAVLVPNVVGMIALVGVLSFGRSLKL
jgi:hypothetical protein